MTDLDPAQSAVNQSKDATSRMCRRVKELRSQRGLTLEQLAERSGVSRSMISQIEREAANPTFGVAYRIAQAFGMSLGELVEEPDPGPRIEVIRVQDRPLDSLDDDKVVRGLHPLHLERDVECYELKLNPGADFSSQPHLPGTCEFITVAKGQIAVQSGEDQQILEQGDAAYYHADVTHCLSNPGDAEAICFMVALYRQREGR